MTRLDRLQRKARAALPPLATAAGLALGASPGIGQAQTIQSFFPSGNSGSGEQLGVTVLTRARSLYDVPGVRVGGFILRPALDQGLIYNSNVNGNGGSGSFGSRTTGSVSAGSDWSRDSLAASIGFAHNEFFSFPSENYTDWNVGLGGGYTIADSLLQAGYAHQTYHQLGTSIGTISSETPVLNQTDTAHVDYTFNLSRFSITPDFGASAYRFGTATAQGQQINQDFLNRNELAGGLTGRYSMSDAGSLLVVVRGVSTDFTTPQAGQPSNNSNSLALLGGIDYQAAGVWRYRFLAGLEVRAFQAAQYATTTAPTVEGSAIWTPTGLTTVTGTLRRAIEAPQTAGTSGFILTEARVVVDHEYMRNVLLQARGAIEYAQYLQSGGTQTGFSGGASVSWLLNRNVRLSLDYDFTRQTGRTTSSSSVAAVTTATSAPYSQSLIALTLHLAL